MVFAALAFAALVAGLALQQFAAARDRAAAARAYQAIPGLADAIRAHYAARGCYPPMSASTIDARFGAVPFGARAFLREPWPDAAAYGAFASNGLAVTGKRTAYYVGMVARDECKAHGGGNTNAGYVWITNGRPVPVRRP